jgi:hypothetical protein
MNDAQALEAQLVENLIRADVHPSDPFQPAEDKGIGNIGVQS